jgi:hypothetical protein
MNGLSVMVVVEDDLSEAVMRRLIASSGSRFSVDRVINERGNTQIKKGILKYKTASHSVPHIVLTDLDRIPCAPVLLNDWRVGELPQRMLFRIAVREVEAWLLADRKGIAEFLAVPTTKIPQQPESLDDPKQTLINLARKSRKRSLAQEIVPENGSVAKYGPLYNARLSQFVSEGWNLDDARRLAPSLDRTVLRIHEFLRD